MLTCVIIGLPVVAHTFIPKVDNQLFSSCFKYIIQILPEINVITSMQSASYQKILTYDLLTFF
jgi:hypothetical protein